MRVNADSASVATSETGIGIGELGGRDVMAGLTGDTLEDTDAVCAGAKAGRNPAPQVIKAIKQPRKQYFNRAA
jgi:hypothetical protein